MAVGTYNNDPTNTPVDRVRFLVQDTAPPFHLSDSEIEFLIASTGNADAAAPQAASAIAGKLSVMADKRVGPLFIRYSELSKNFGYLAKTLTTRLGLMGAGGPVLTQTDRGPMFAIGMNDMYAETDPHIWPNGTIPDGYDVTLPPFGNM